MAKIQLKRRERIVIIGGVLLLAMVALMPMYNDFSRRYKNSKNQVHQAVLRLEHVRELRGALELERSGHQALVDRIKRRSGSFDLYSYTNRSLRDLKLQDRASLEDRKMLSGGSLFGVQLNLRGVSMDEFVNLLHRLYSSNNLIVVQRLNHLRPARDGKGLDCQITFIAPRS